MCCVTHAISKSQLQSRMHGSQILCSVTYVYLESLSRTHVSQFHTHKAAVELALKVNPVWEKHPTNAAYFALHIQINSISYSGLGRLKHLGKLKSLNKGRICFLWSLHWQEIQFDFFICSALFIFLFHHHHV